MMEWRSLRCIWGGNLEIHNECHIIFRREMKAVQYTSNGDLDKILSLETVDLPPLKDDEVRVKIHVASINLVDVLVASGYLVNAGWSMPLPFIPGYDLAGTVESFGSQVTGYEVGERVAACNWGNTKHDNGDEPVGGAFAEYIHIPAYKLSKVPSNVSLEQAAAVVLVGTTAYQVIFDVIKVTASSRILILGASSAVGSIAVQLAKNAGAYVIVTSSERSKAYVSQLNPDLIIDYTIEKWDEHPLVQDIDFVFDTVGESNAFARSRKPGLIKLGGGFVSIVSPDCGYNPSAYLPELSFGAFFGLSNSSVIQSEIFDLLSTGKLVITIDEEFDFTLEGVIALVHKAISKKSLGKNILRIAK